MLDITQTLGWIATVLFTIMLIPQILKTIRSKDTKGVSLLLFITYLIANVIALIYAWLIAERPLIIKYLLGIITAEIYIIVFIWFYKKRSTLEVKS
jgi:MtN3 and saliva related transmembrane protein